MAGLYTCQVLNNDTGEKKEDKLEIRVHSGDIPPTADIHTIEM